MARGLDDDLRELEGCLRRLRAACRRLQEEDERALAAVARQHLAELRALAARVDQHLGGGVAPVPGSCPSCGQSWWRYRSTGGARWECSSCGWTALDEA